MLWHYVEATEHADRFAERYGLTYGRELGKGYDGIVFATDAPSAVKAFRHEPLYHKELAVYRRLEAKGVTEMHEFVIPRLIRADAELWVLEMEWVEPPFVLDFAGARLDEEPEHFRDPDYVAEWRAEKLEQFGPERWPVVTGVLATFRRYGVWLTDVKPGNIEFADDDQIDGEDGET